MDIEVLNEIAKAQKILVCRRIILKFYVAIGALHIMGIVSNGVEIRKKTCVFSFEDISLSRVAFSERIVAYFSDLSLVERGEGKDQILFGG